MSECHISRRQFVKTTSAGAAAIALLSGSDAMAGWFDPKPIDPITLDLTKPENAVLRTVGGALKVSNTSDKHKPIIVIRSSDTEVVAFSSKCTHDGCEISLPVKGTMVCPCHDSQFDTKGAATKGPARKNLKSFSATLAGDVLTITEPQKESAK
jgi:Rieske Fe-S protein